MTIIHILNVYCLPHSVYSYFIKLFTMIAISTLQCIQVVHKTSSFKTTLIINNTKANQVSCNTISYFTFKNSRQISCYKFRWWQLSRHPHFKPLSLNNNPSLFPLGGCLNTGGMYKLVGLLPSAPLDVGETLKLFLEGLTVGPLRVKVRIFCVRIQLLFM